MPPSKKKNANPTIMAMTRILEKPIRGIIPKVAKSHKSNNIPATCLIGEGRIPTAQAVTKKISTSQIVIA